MWWRPRETRGIGFSVGYFTHSNTSSGLLWMNEWLIHAYIQQRSRESKKRWNKLKIEINFESKGKDQNKKEYDRGSERRPVDVVWTAFDGIKSHKQTAFLPFSNFGPFPRHACVEWCPAGTLLPSPPEETQTDRRAGFHLLQN